MSERIHSLRGVMLAILIPLAALCIPQSAGAQQQSAQTLVIVTGKVKDAKTGDPLIGATLEFYAVDSAASDFAKGVLVFPSKPVRSTAANIYGEYFIRGLAPGLWQVHAVYYGYREGIRTLEVVEGTTEQDFPLDPEFESMNVPAMRRTLAARSHERAFS